MLRLKLLDFSSEDIMEKFFFTINSSNYEARVIEISSSSKLPLKLI